MVLSSWKRVWLKPSERLRHIYMLICIAVLVMVAYPSWVLPGGMGFDDLSRLNAPQRMLLGWFYHMLQWPFWNPFSFGGQPFLAAGQSGPLYPPNLIYAILPIHAALSLSYLGHEWLVAFGTYAVAWHFTKHRIASAFSAIAFVTCGFFVGHQIHTQMFDAMCWLPWTFWWLLKLLQSVTLRRMAGLAVTLAMEIYAGHPQVTFYILLFCTLYTLLHVLWHWRHISWKTLSAAAISVIWGLFLSAPQWVSTVEFVLYSNRDHASQAFLLEGSMPLSGLLQGLSPFVIGGGYTHHVIDNATTWPIDQSGLFWEFSMYVGLVTLLLAVAAVFVLWRRQNAVRSFSVIGALTMCLALGSYGFLDGLLVHAPGFDLFRIPARYIGLTDFSMAILAGITVKHLWCSEERLVRRLRLAVGISALCGLLTLAAAWAVGPLSLEPVMAFWGSAILAAGLLLISFGIQHRILYAGLLMVIGTFDCVSQAALLSPFVVIDTPSYTHPSTAVQFLQTHLPTSTDPFARVAAFGETSLSYDKPVAYRIPALNGYDSLEPEWYARNINLTWSNATLMAQPRSILDVMDVRYLVTPQNTVLFTGHAATEQSWSHWLPKIPKDAAGFEIHLANFSMPADGLPLMRATLRNGLRVFSRIVNHEATGQVYIPLPTDWPRDGATELTLRNESWDTTYEVSRLTLISAQSQPMEFLVNGTLGPKPWHKVVVGDGEAVWANPDMTDSTWFADSRDMIVAPQPGNITWVSWSPNHFTLQVQHREADTLVLAQTYDPGWHVKIDGHPAAPFRAGGAYGDALSGVTVPAGHHLVQWFYRPRGFIPALGVSALGLLGVLATLIHSGWLSRRKRSR